MWQPMAGPGCAQEATEAASHKWIIVIVDVARQAAQRAAGCSADLA